eukprot:TRINITY_DN10595_c0_g1_i6.p1 TRINITY_DN10595_c0_g1~~TRINITY_DN10595_c0_g1_i6.p1  ORF type:complete len:115 (-),score=16.88 TRINITY_DN10595_c0_g1_i6:345-689(-)
MFKAAAEQSAAAVVNTSQPRMSCPICGTNLPENQIESHVDQCLSSLGGEPTTHQSPPSRAFGGATTNPGQWAEMNRCELNQILQQGLSSRELQSLEHSLQGFLNQVRKATSREQ